MHDRTPDLDLMPAPCPASACASPVRRRPSGTLTVLAAAAASAALPAASAWGGDACRLRWDPTIGLPGLEAGAISVMLPFDDGSGPALYVGGTFEEIGGVQAQNIARWNGSAFEAVGVGLTLTPSAQGEVRTLCVFDDGSGPALYAGGHFRYAAGQSIGFSIARWDGSAWQPVGGGLEGSTPQANAMCVYDDGSGDALIIGGQLRSPDSEVNDGIVAWDGRAYRSLGGGIAGSPPQVNALAVLSSPDFAGGGDWLLLGGHFQFLGGEFVQGIAKWDGTAWSSLGQGIAGSIATISNIVIHDDGSGSGAAAYVTGDFTSVDGRPASSAARWYPWGHWEPLGDAYMTNADLVRFDAGAGPEVHAATAVGLRAWRDGAWVEATPGVWGVKALAVFDDGHGGDALYLGGIFTSVGGLETQRFARWQCTCDGDVDLDGGVDAEDLRALLAAWGWCDDCPADLDGDGEVGITDLLAVLDTWGGCP